MISVVVPQWVYKSVQECAPMSVEECAPITIFSAPAAALCWASPVLRAVFDNAQPFSQIIIMILASFMTTRARVLKKMTTMLSALVQVPW